MSHGSTTFWHSHKQALMWMHWCTTDQTSLYITFYSYLIYCDLCVVSCNGCISVLCWSDNASVNWLKSGAQINGDLLFLAAIHQRRHALLHLDQDEWQWKRRRERTNPHPWLPQNSSDATLYEPHCQHGTGCLWHVTTIRLCWQRRTGKVGQRRSTRLLTS